MGLDVAKNTFTGKRITPCYDPRNAVEIAVNLGPNLTLTRGTVLGQVTSSANDVQTYTITGTPTGGGQTLTFTDPNTGKVTSAIIPYNASSSSAQTLVNAAVGSGNLTVGGGTLPGTALTFTAAGNWAAMPVAPITLSLATFTGGSSPAGAITHTTTGVTANTFGAYSSAVVAAPATAPTITAGGSDGTIGAGTYLFTYTFVNAQGETTQSPGTFATLTSAQHAAVTSITGIATGVTAVNVYIDGQFALQQAVTSGATGGFNVLAAATGVPVYAPTVNGAYTIPNGAGTQTAKAILPWDVATDAGGNITLGTTTGGGEFNETWRTVPVYVNGYFATQDLVGLDATAVTQLGHLVTGTTTLGVLVIE